MAVVNISGASYSFLPFNSHIPGAKVCGPIPLYVLGYDTYVLDLSQTVTTAQLKNGIQSVFIDASQCFGGEITISCSLTNQVISIKGGQQGYFPIMVSGTSTFTITTTTQSNAYVQNVQVLLYFYNVPFTSAVWDANNQANTDYPVGGQIQLAAGVTSQNLFIASFVNQYLITSYSFSLIPNSYAIPTRVQVALLLNGEVVDADNWLIGPEPLRHPPMKATGLNLLWNTPQHTNGKLELFVSTSSALPVALVFWYAFLGHAL